MAAHSAIAAEVELASKAAMPCSVGTAEDCLAALPARLYLVSTSPAPE